jgi:hypothetical protein
VLKIRVGKSSYIANNNIENGGRGEVSSTGEKYFHIERVKKTQKNTLVKVLTTNFVSECLNSTIIRKH